MDNKTSENSGQESPVPVFAIIGHPNEGKSSVVSTLAENDRVRVGPMPGETLVCEPLSVTIDGKKIITFVDTPGFQNPRETLAWMRRYQGPDELLTQSFIDAHKDNPRFRDECELLKPVARGAGIIYVVDGSRPIRNIDKIEMEILRLTARPRMSVINCKSHHTQWLDQWKTAFRRNFNATRIFNAHKATWIERIDLLESLKVVDQEWQPAISHVIDEFKKEWNHRNELTASMTVEMLQKILTFSTTTVIKNEAKFDAVKKSMEDVFRKELEQIEKETHSKIRLLYRHNIFNCELPPNSILHEELFSRKTWQFLGLSPGELSMAAGFAGGAAGALVDVVAAGLTFGIFAALGGVAGAGYALLKGRGMADLKFKGIPLGRDQLKIGPLCSLQFMYILLDRLLIFHGSVINWAHARRDGFENVHDEAAKKVKQGITSGWSDDWKKVCGAFFQNICPKKNRNGSDLPSDIRIKMEGIIKTALEKQD
ncbi:MAG: GTPase/DUF3482 domain-containing protein [Desulfamplus sp.]|nr:GTPase/DUF3482 domain-containing protein [Desulfamplus sp.]